MAFKVLNKDLIGSKLRTENEKLLYSKLSLIVQEMLMGTNTLPPEERQSSANDLTRLLENYFPETYDLTYLRSVKSRVSGDSEMLVDAWLKEKDVVLQPLSKWKAEFKPLVQTKRGDQRQLKFPSNDSYFSRFI